MTTIKMGCTCSGCPTQYEGTIDGIPAYFRYRHGHWSLDLHPFTPQAETVAAGQYVHESGADGVMDEEMVFGIILGAMAVRAAHQEVTP